MMTDYYRILGVTPDATRDEIRRAYRHLARRYHPDANPGDKRAEARIKQINEAHAVLMDPMQREQYDASRPRRTRTAGRATRGPESSRANHESGDDALVSIRRKVSRPNVAVDVNVDLSGLAAGFGMFADLIGGLDRLVSAADRAIAGYGSAPEDGSGHEHVSE